MASHHDGYSRMVAFLKIVLPLIALAILSTLFLISNVVDPSEKIPFTDVDIQGMAREQSIGSPSYSGVTKNGAAFTVTADNATPTFGDDKGMTAHNIAAMIDTKSGATIDFTAPDGTFQEKTDQAVMYGGVRIVTSDGYTMVSDVIHAKMDMSVIETDSLVTATGPFGDFTAGKMVITQQSEQGSKSDYLLVFTEGVNLVYLPLVTVCLAVRFLLLLLEYRAHAAVHDREPGFKVHHHLIRRQRIRALRQNHVAGHHDRAFVHIIDSFT